MMPDDAALLRRFDDFLDEVASDGRAGVDGLEAEMVETVTFLRSAAKSVSPDPAFAAGLRRTLVQRGKAAAVSAPSGMPLRATMSPLATPFSTRRWWPRFELAAMVLMILAVAGSLANGGGFRVIGPRSGDGDGRTIPGYSTGSPMASPVATSGAVRESVAILFVADVSGSMTYDPLGSTPPIEMLKEALQQAVNALADGDEIGVLAFNDRQNWVIPMTKIDGQETRDRIDADIGEMTAEGGTEIFPALGLAFDAIERSTATKRHVILLTDGKSRTGTIEDYQALVATAVAGGVTLSTVGIGSDADTSLLQLLASAGHGRYHVATASVDIPAVTLEEVGLVTGRKLTTPTPTTIPSPSAIGPGDHVRVVDDDVNLRAQPRINADVVAVMTKDQALIVTGEPAEGDGFVWLPVIDDAAGLDGWVVEDWVTATPSSGGASTATANPPIRQAEFRPGENVVITDDGVNLRSEPRLGDNIVDVLAAGTRLIVMGDPIRDGGIDWLPVTEVTTGTRGYVNIAWAVQPAPPTATATPVNVALTLDPTATPYATVTPVDADALVDPTPTPTPAAAPSTRFEVGATVYIAQPRVALREGPSFEARTITMPTEGTPLTILGPSQEAQGVIWWPVGDPATGDAGFVVEDGLSSERPAPTPTPSPLVNDGYVDPGNKVEVSVTVDATGLINEDPVAKADAIEQFREVLAPYEGCIVGFALTFGWSADLGQGISTADAVNRLLREAFPEMFGRAAFESFANLRDPAGQVDVDLYFYQGCVGQPSQAGTPPATATPVSARTAGSPTAEQAANTVLFLIDKSGSMSYDPLGGVSKLEMQKETVRRAVAAMPAGTSIGVIAFNEGQEWVVPMTDIGEATSDADRAGIVAAVDAIVPEGGSYLNPLLLKVMGPPRGESIPGLTQIVLLSDGKFADHDPVAYRTIVELLAKQGIAFSTIAFGSDADSATMQLLAEAGNGRYHRVETLAEVPTLSVQNGVLSIVEQAATPVAGAGG